MKQVGRMRRYAQASRDGDRHFEGIDAVYGQYHGAHQVCCYGGKVKMHGELIGAEIGAVTDNNTDRYPWMLGQPCVQRR